LEPEVASMFVKEIQIERRDDELSKYRPGKKFLVVDLGGKFDIFSVHSFIQLTPVEMIALKIFCHF
jgi:hypothetical protein